jgi:hypothetical protein
LLSLIFIIGTSPVYGYEEKGEVFLKKWCKEKGVTLMKSTDLSLKHYFNNNQADA